MHYPSLKDHPSPLGHGRELASGHCRPVRHTRPALPTHLPERKLSEDSEEDESAEDNDDEEDNCVPRRCNDSSESSDMNSIDSTSDTECEYFTPNKIGIVLSFTTNIHFHCYFHSSDYRY